MIKISEQAEANVVSQEGETFGAEWSQGDLASACFMLIGSVNKGSLQIW